MNDGIKTVAVVRGAPNTVIQDLFQKLAARWRPAIRLAGVTAESHGLADRACSAGYLRSIATGERFSMFQDQGPGSTACHLDGLGVVGAAEAVRRDIAAGCELVLLNKFGKLEAAGGGLAAAFKAAIGARIPLLTTLSPSCEEAWRHSGFPPFVILGPDPASIEAWRAAARISALP